MVLQVNRPENTALSDSHRVIWCPYIPDEDETSGTTVNTTADSSVAEDISKLLVLTHDKVVSNMKVHQYGTGTDSYFFFITSSPCKENLFFFLQSPDN